MSDVVCTEITRERAIKIIIDRLFSLDNHDLAELAERMDTGMYNNYKIISEK